VPQQQRYRAPPFKYIHICNYSWNLDIFGRIFECLCGSFPFQLPKDHTLQVIAMFFLLVISSFFFFFWFSISSSVWTGPSEMPSAFWVLVNEIFPSFYVYAGRKMEGSLQLGCLSVGYVNCCCSSPADLCFFPGPAWFMTIFFFLTTALGSRFLSNYT
jgi:hypothetical protein